MHDDPHLELRYTIRSSVSHWANPNNREHKYYLQWVNRMLLVAIAFICAVATVVVELPPSSLQTWEIVRTVVWVTGLTAAYTIAGHLVIEIGYVVYWICVDVLGNAFNAMRWWLRGY